MLKFTLSVVCSLLFASFAHAEFHVQNTNGDLKLTYSWEQSDPSNVSSVYITQSGNWQIAIYPLGGHTIDGSSSAVYSMPADDLIIEGVQNVYIALLDMSQLSDDLRVYTSDYVYLSNVQVGQYSHSMIDVTTREFYGKSLVTTSNLNITARNYNHIRDLTLLDSYIGNSCYITMDSFGSLPNHLDTTTEIENVMFENTLWMKMSKKSDFVWLTRLYVNGDFWMDMGDDNDILEYDQQDGYLNNHYVDFGKGVDTLYQAPFVFDYNDTDNLEYRKRL